MGQKPKLTEKQWAEIAGRLLRGEKITFLAKEYGVSDAAIRKKIGSETNHIKVVANQLVSAETELRKLPIGSQIHALNLADELRSISENLASAARYGSMTAHRLAGIANKQVDKIDDSDPLANTETLKGIATLTRMGNEASEIGLNLLRANKDTVPERPDAVLPPSFDVADAAKVYMRLMD